MVREKRKLHPAEGIFTLLLLGLSIFILVSAYTISGFSSISSPGAFPMVAAAIMVLSAIYLIIENRVIKDPEAESIKKDTALAIKEIFRPEILVFSGIIILYMILIVPIHFLPSSFIFLVISMVYLKGSTLIKSLLITAVTLGAIYIIFHYFFKVVSP